VEGKDFFLARGRKSSNRILTAQSILGCTAPSVAVVGEIEGMEGEERGF
jgi:hypothetical protein